MDATLRDKAEETGQVHRPEYLDSTRVERRDAIDDEVGDRTYFDAEMDVHLSQGREAALPQSPTAAPDAKVPTAEPAADTPQTPRPDRSAAAAIAGTAPRPRPCKVNQDG